MSKIIKNKNNIEITSYFKEDVFYPRLKDQEKEIEAAKKEALRIVQEAENQAGMLVQKFHDKGIETGIEEVKPLTAILSSLIEEMKAFKKTAVDELEPIVVDLALRISKKVIKDEVKQNPEIVINNVRAALKNMIDKERIVIQVNPADKELLEKHQKAIVDSFRDIQHLVITPDPSVLRGGCYLKSDRGDVDATLEVQYSEVAKSFLKEENYSEDDTD